MSSDGGRDATETTFGGWFAPRVRPNRLEVRDSPDRAVDNAVAELVAQGFTVAAQDIGAVLARQGSPWVARLVEIGDRGAARKRAALIDVVDVVTLGLGGDFMKRRVDHLQIVVTARRTASGSAELVVGPATLPTLDESKAAPGHRFAAALQRLADGYARGGGLVGKPSSMSSMKDRDCPANYGTAKQLLRQAT